MTMKVGMRELSRNLSILDNYDYVEVEDKKTHEYKGLFVSAKYASEFKSFLENKIDKEIKEQLDIVEQFAGKGKIQERFNNLTSSEIREKVVKEKYGY